MTVALTPARIGNGKGSPWIPLDTLGTRDAQLMWRNCPSSGVCLQLRDGRLFACHHSAWRDALNEPFGTEFEPEPGDYLELNTLTDVEQIERFRRCPKPACRFCALDRTDAIEWRRSEGSREEWLVPDE